MNATQLFTMIEEDNTQLDEMHERYAYKHAMEDLGLNPEEAFAFAKQSLVTPIDTGDDE
jgi:hypothetical protein